MAGGTFHHDLLTPGIVDRVDPPPIDSGMVGLTLDHLGFLTAFEAIPPQVEAAASPSHPIDWTPLLTLAGLDPSTLQAAEPQWNWLASADTRAAWTGVWSPGGQPMRVEAAALHGKAVAFQAGGAWTKPWRSSPPTTSGEFAFVGAVFLLALAILIGGGVLARRNLREGRGDRIGALTLGSAVVVVLWGVWLCQVHVSASLSLFGSFLLAVCTTLFYGLLFWAIYLALEPFVRRYWPQTLVSWTTLLGGRVRDPIVGRDVLVGTALGVTIALIIRATSHDPAVPPTELLLGVRSTAGELLMHVVYATRTALFVFFLLFLFRVLLRNQWLAALVFVTLYAVLNTLNSTQPIFDATMSFVYFSMFAVAVLRWGLTTLAVGVLVADLLLIAPATTSVSAWYVGEMTLVLAIPLALATWAFVTSISGRLRTPVRA
jgi:hypothetical protein